MNYPSSPISSINPSEYIDNPCPDFTGTYEAVGRLIDGDTTRSAGTTRLFTWIFPLTDPTSWNDIRLGYRRDKNGIISRFPDFAIVEQLSPRAVRITIGYKDHVIGTFKSNYEDADMFVCKGGKLMSGGADKITSYSEWGPNHSGQRDALYEDGGGNIIYEIHDYVHMTWLGIVPTGTAKYHAKYLFKKLK
ncbi:MAG: hypothetical protein ACREGF_04615 [Candidatus Saccharimonadales bacterium]